MAVGELDVCHRLCIELINANNLPTVVKIETIQVMCMLVPLDQALSYLEDAERIVRDRLQKEPEDLMWLGLLTTTRDLLWKICKFQGTVKFHGEITFGDPYAAARDRDLKKGDPVKKQVRAQDEYDDGPSKGNLTKKKVQYEAGCDTHLKESAPIENLVQSDEDQDKNFRKGIRLKKKVHFHEDVDAREAETTKRRPLKKVHFQDEGAQKLIESFQRSADLSLHTNDS